MWTDQRRPWLTYKNVVCVILSIGDQMAARLYIMSHPHRAGVLLGEHCSLCVHVHSGF
jgi:hypothetical protein